jgi:hypothetical protein
VATRRDAAGGLPLHLADFLLGVSRTAAEIEHLHTQGVAYDAFAEFVLDRMTPDEFRELWRRHGAALRGEAARRGITPPDPSTYYLLADGNRAFWTRRRT